MEEENFSENRTTLTSRDRWKVRRKSIRFFRPNRHLVSVGYWREKSFRTFWPNSDFCQGSTGEKLSEVFGQTACFPPVGSGEKKVLGKADHFTSFCQGKIEGKKIQNLSFKAGKTLQWVVRKRFMRIIRQASGHKALPERVTVDDALFRNFSIRPKNSHIEKITECTGIECHQRPTPLMEPVISSGSRETVDLHWEAIVSDQCAEKPVNTRLSRKKCRSCISLH